MLPLVPVDDSVAVVEHKELSESRKNASHFERTTRERYDA